MLCPQCRQQMEKGCLGDRNIYWQQEHRRGLVFGETYGDVALSSGSFFSAVTVGYLCRGCRFVIVPIPPKKEKEKQR